MDVEISSIKKHEDRRGYLLEILKENETEENIAQIYFSTTKPGVIRGGHYHKKKVEWFSVVTGKALLYLECKNTKEQMEIVLEQNSPAVVKISPFIIHAIKNVGEKEMLLIVISSAVYDEKNTDTYSD